MAQGAGRRPLVPSPRLSRPWAPGSVGRSVSNAFRGPSGQRGARREAGATREPAERRRTLMGGSLVCPSAPRLPGPAHWLLFLARPAPRNKPDSRPPSLAYAGASWGSAPPAGGRRGRYHPPGRPDPGPCSQLKPRALPGSPPGPSLTPGGAGRHRAQGRGQGGGCVAEPSGSWGGGPSSSSGRAAQPLPRARSPQTGARSPSRRCAAEGSWLEALPGPPAPAAGTLHPAPLLHRPGSPSCSGAAPSARALPLGEAGASFPSTPAQRRPVSAFILNTYSHLPPKQNDSKSHTHQQAPGKPP